jgi:hypothetical protein
VKRFLAVYREQVGEEFPTDPRQHLERAILAVFRSWMSERAVKYREVQKIMVPLVGHIPSRASAPRASARSWSSPPSAAAPRAPA